MKLDLTLAFLHASFTQIRGWSITSMHIFRELTFIFFPAFSSTYEPKIRETQFFLQPRS